MINTGIVYSSMLGFPSVPKPPIPFHGSTCSRALHFTQFTPFCSVHEPSNTTVKFDMHALRKCLENPPRVPLLPCTTIAGSILGRTNASAGIFCIPNNQSGHGGKSGCRSVLAPLNGQISYYLYCHRDKYSVSCNVPVPDSDTHVNPPCWGSSVFVLVDPGQSEGLLL